MKFVFHINLQCLNGKSLLHKCFLSSLHGGGKRGDGPVLDQVMLPFSVLLTFCATQGASSSGLLFNARVCPISVTLIPHLPPNTLTKLMAFTQS